MTAMQSLDPRPLEELTNEQAYLLHDLRKQGERARRLFQRYAAVEARLAAAVSPSETKKCKKEATLVRAKIAESTQQEQLIWLRLTEIHVELQNRDRWMQEPDTTATTTPPSAAATEYFSCGSRSASLLSPLSPCFTPGVVFAEDIWSRASGASSGGKKEAEEAAEAEVEAAEVEEVEEEAVEEKVEVEVEAGEAEVEAAEKVEEKAAEADGSLPPPGKEEEVGEGNAASRVDEGVVSREVVTELEGECSQRVERDPGGEEERGVSFDERPGRVNSDGAPRWDPELDADSENTQAWRERLRRVSLYLPLPLKARDKRLSVPYLKSMWSRSRRNSLQSMAG
ncbi:ec2754d5-4274-46b7-bc51-dc67b4e98e60 [Thermothielavioides terrestris]|uniref:Ec2754d5-4274-46b7-bc51-dc67b4e98e60 n=1 Tax=Thermothielavioides terrestris TaxID=2587410 RepID=A0A446BMQ5_9PEZI|nr:ec2754d5-4274-46b7-bc51-dc67b4e98e60 [Thermothielavioides terrestris]